MSVQPENGAIDALRVEHIAKSFGPVTALRDVSLSLRKGEVLGLIGDNGAGKSTLVKILSGFHRPDAGAISVFGEPVQFKSVIHARSLGIDTVYQDLALVPGLSVYHNMFLKREHTRLKVLDNRSMRNQARSHLNSLGVNIPDVNAEVASLSGGQRQAIAVARSVFSDARIILLDEPLAAMGAKEGGLILKLIRELRERGDVSQIVIAHNYLHVLETCDRVCLLQNGRITFDRPTAETSIEELLNARRRGVPRARRVSRDAANGGPDTATAAPMAAGLAEHVYLLLKAEVINDQFAAGERIVIESVAIRLGVSPTPVREALARLAGEQLVASAPTSATRRCRRSRSPSCATSSRRAR